MYSSQSKKENTLSYLINYLSEKSTLATVRVLMTVLINFEKHKLKVRLHSKRYNNFFIFNSNSQFRFCISVLEIISDLETKFEVYLSVYILKMRPLLKIENNSSWVNLTHFRGKTHLLALELIFVSSSRRVHMHIKFDI